MQKWLDSSVAKLTKSFLVTIRDAVQNLWLILISFFFFARTNFITCAVIKDVRKTIDIGN